MSLEGTRDVTGRAVLVGDIVAWFKGGRYDCIVIGRVASFTEMGSLRITVLWADRPEDYPAESMRTVQRLRTVLIERSSEDGGGSSLRSLVTLLAEREARRAARAAG